MPEPEPTPTPSPEPIVLVDKNNMLIEGFEQHLPEDVRTAESIKAMPRDIPNIIKKLVNAERAIGKNKIALPGPKATEAELNEFYNAIGRPKTVQDYGETKKPDDIPDQYWDSDRVTGFKTLAHKIGLTKAQADALIGFDTEYMKTMIAKTAEDDINTTAQAGEALKRKMGMAYEQNVHNVNVLFDKTNEGNDARKAEMIAKYGRDPLFIEWASEVSKAFIEHEIMPGEIGKMIPKDALAEINTLQNTQGYMSGDLKKKDPIKHEQIFRKIMELNKIAYPDEKSAG